MKITIVIPHFKEKEKDVFPLLSSIEIQVGINYEDLEVIISNDGGDFYQLDEKFLSSFSYEIKQIYLSQNRGPGITRQHGIDKATGDYILFCDADDCLHNVGVLGAFINEINTNHPDIIYTSWIEEVMVGDKPNYVLHEKENTWMHGKIINRKFIKNHQLRFHDDLRIHEDSYFLSNLAALTKNMRYLPITSYVWKYHKNSITRIDDAAYTYTSWPEFVRACDLSHEFIQKHAMRQLHFKVYQLIVYNFFVLHQSHWQEPKHKKYLRDAEKAIAKYIKKWRNIFDKVDQETRSKVYKEEREKNFKDGIETETLLQWINRITK